MAGIKHMPPIAVKFVVHVLCIVSMASSDLHVFSLKHRDQDILKMSSPTIRSMNSLVAMPDAQPPSGSSSLEASYVSDSAPRCAVCCCWSFSSWLWPSAQPRNGRDEGLISLMATSKLVCVDEEAEGHKKMATWYKAPCLGWRIQSETGNCSVVFYIFWILLILTSSPSKYLQKYLSTQTCHRP